MGPLKSMKYGSLVKAMQKFTIVRQNYGKCYLKMCNCYFLKPMYHLITSLWKAKWGEGNKKTNDCRYRSAMIYGTECRRIKE